MPVRGPGARQQQAPATRRQAGSALLLSLAMAQFMVVLDFSIVNVALPPSSGTCTSPPRRCSVTWPTLMSAAQTLQVAAPPPGPGYRPSRLLWLGALGVGHADPDPLCLQGG